MRPTQYQGNLGFFLCFCYWRHSGPVGIGRFCGKSCRFCTGECYGVVGVEANRPLKASWIQFTQMETRHGNLKAKDMDLNLTVFHMGVSKNKGVSPQIIHLNRVFHYKPSILGYIPLFLVQHPYDYDNKMQFTEKMQRLLPTTWRSLDRVCVFNHRTC